MQGTRRPACLTQAEQQQQLITAVGGRVNGFGEHRAGTGERSGSELANGNAKVGGQRINNGFRRFFFHRYRGRCSICERLWASGNAYYGHAAQHVQQRRAMCCAAPSTQSPRNPHALSSAAISRTITSSIDRLAPPVARKSASKRA